MDKSIKPSERSLEAFIQKFPDQGPLVMLNRGTREMDGERPCGRHSSGRGNVR